MAENLGLRKNSRFIAISTAPSLNKTPRGPSTPVVAYPVYCDLGSSEGTISNVRFNNEPAYVLNQSMQPKCIGDEQGTAGGIRSGTFNGKVKPVNGSPPAKISHSQVVRENDRCTLNNENCPGIFVTQSPPSNDSDETSQNIRVTIRPAQKLACPDEPLPITAIGTPGGGIFEWTHSPTCELLNESGHPTLTGSSVKLRLLQDPDSSIPVKNVNVSVTYRHPNGDAHDMKSIQLHNNFDLATDIERRVGNKGYHWTRADRNPSPDSYNFESEDYAVVVIPGMNMTQEDARQMHFLVDLVFGVRSSALIPNYKNLCVGSYIQSFEYEQIGAIDPLMIMTADAVCKGLKIKKEVYVVAHSQGSQIFVGAMKVLTKRVMPGELKNIHYQGFGSETFVSKTRYGLGSARNVRNARDPFPDFGDSAKLALGVEMVEVGTLLRDGTSLVNAEKQFHSVPAEKWEKIDSQFRMPHWYCLFYRHGFTVNYWTYIKVPLLKHGAPDSFTPYYEILPEENQSVQALVERQREVEKQASGFKVIGKSSPACATLKSKDKPNAAIACFMDGTANNPSSRTNIRLMYESLCRPSSQTHRSYTVFPKYFQGPGAEEWHFWRHKTQHEWNVVGQVFGGVCKKIAERAYRAIAREYEDLIQNGYAPPKIDIFGFSRGAAIANEIAWFLDTRGIQREDGSTLVAPHQAQVRFLGLFETVHSIDGPGPNTSHAYHTMHIAPCVVNAAHALAGDETRVYFLPSLVTPIRKSGNFNELIFPGVHSDVGGFISNNQDIRRLTLSWMAENAELAGASYLDSLKMSETEKMAILQDPQRTKCGNMGFPNWLDINPLYWEHRRVELANTFSKNILGYTVAVSAASDLFPSLQMLKPGPDTFAMQDRYMHEERLFPARIHRLLPKRDKPQSLSNPLPSDNTDFDVANPSVQHYSQPYPTPPTGGFHGLDRMIEGI